MKVGNYVSPLIDIAKHAGPSITFLPFVPTQEDICTVVTVTLVNGDKLIKVAETVPIVDGQEWMFDSKYWKVIDLPEISLTNLLKQTSKV